MERMIRYVEASIHNNTKDLGLTCEEDSHWKDRLSPTAYRGAWNSPESEVDRGAVLEVNLEPVTRETAVQCHWRMYNGWWKDVFGHQRSI